MLDYKTLKKSIIALAVLFGVDLVVLVISIGRLNKFTIGSLFLLLIVGIYFTGVALKLLNELRKNDKG